MLMRLMSTVVCVDDIDDNDHCYELWIIKSKRQGTTHPQTTSKPPIRSLPLQPSHLGTTLEPTPIHPHLHSPQHLYPILIRPLTPHQIHILRILFNQPMFPHRPLHLFPPHRDHRQREMSLVVEFLERLRGGEGGGGDGVEWGGEEDEAGEGIGGDVGLGNGTAYVPSCYE